jgi:exodeoxyribonuclease VII large subunit
LEQLKKEMAAQGYFNAEHKKSLPKYPQAIGVVTAITGAAIHDIITTVKKRDNRINIYIYPAKVQGQGAAEEISAGIQTLDQIEDIDLIIAGRGGGSIEDLWAFNEKKIALAFFNCQKPIISAVGHEIDFLLSDLVADVRAATPTQAVEICIPEREKIWYEVVSKWKYLRSISRKYIDYLQSEIDGRRNSYSIKNFARLLERYSRMLIDRETEIQRALSLHIQNKKNELALKTGKISGFNPIQVLERGYSIVTSRGKLIKQAADVRAGDPLSITTAGGIIEGTVNNIK